MTAGTSTIPPFSGAANWRRLALKMVDFSNDENSLSLYISATATDAEVQAFIDAYQAVTQTSTYCVIDEFAYVGARSTSNAQQGIRASAEQGINLSFKNVASPPPNTFPVRVAAPEEATMVGTSDVVNGTAPTLIALTDAVTVLRAGFVVQSAQYTTHRERSSNNTKVAVG